MSSARQTERRPRAARRCPRVQPRLVACGLAFSVFPTLFTACSGGNLRAMAGPGTLGDGSAGGLAGAASARPSSAGGAGGSPAASRPSSSTDDAGRTDSPDSGQGGANGGGDLGPDAGGVEAGAAEAAPGDRNPAAPDAGATAPSTNVPFFLGADITWVQADEARGATFTDGGPTGGTTEDIFAILKQHGFNAVRLRLFVDPRAADGYDPVNGYGDLAHTLVFARRIKAAGMRFLLDLHYSDNWADPGKQCVPIAWQRLTTVTALASAVRGYTTDVVSQLIAGGARPDMVQVGNEITPGMLIHRCDATGQPISDNPVTGRITNWTNLGMLLKAGADAVKASDPGILVMIHIDRGSSFDTSRDYIANAMAAGVPFDVFGESCYTAYQGPPSTWSSTFTQLAAAFPTLKFAIAEYGPEQRAANDIVLGLPAQRGIGTFDWEPTHSGAWNVGHELFTATGNAYAPTPDLGIYDTIHSVYVSRLTP